jgi:hypothetical protein
MQAGIIQKNGNFLIAGMEHFKNVKKSMLFPFF